MKVFHKMCFFLLAAKKDMTLSCIMCISFDKELTLDLTCGYLFFTFFMICGSFGSFSSAAKVIDIVPVILNQRQDERRERWQAVRRSNSVGVR